MEGGEGPPKTPTNELHFTTPGRPPRPPMTAEMMQQAQLQMLSQWRTRGPPMPTMSRAPMPHYRPTSPMGSPVMRPTTPRATPPKVTGLPIFKYFHTVPPYAVEMNETQFVDSLSRFMGLINLPLRKVPRFKDQPIQMHSLYRTVTAFGGFHRCLVSLFSGANHLGPHALIAQVQNLTPGAIEEESKGLESRGLDARGLESQGLDPRGSEFRGLESRDPGSRGSEFRSLEAQSAESRGSETQSPETRTAESRSTEPQIVKSQSSESQYSKSPYSESRHPDQRHPDTRHPDTRNPDPRHPDLRHSDSRHPDLRHSEPRVAETMNMGTISTDDLLRNSEPIAEGSPIIPAKRPMSSPTTRTREDDVKDMLRGGQLMLRKLSCTPTVGKISYEELFLMLNSDLTAVQNAGLGILERLSFDSNAALSAASVVSLIRALANLLSAEVLNSLNVKVADSNTEGTDTKMDNLSELPDRIRNQRPFVFLRRKAEEEGVGLLSRPKPKSSRIESIVNVLRNWSVRTEIPAIMAGEEHFVWRVLVPILTKEEVWSSLSLECYSGLWMVFVQISSLITLTEGTRVEALLSLAVDEVKHCLQDYRAHAVAMNPELYLGAVSTAAVKNSIIQFIKVANATWKTIPPHCFLLMDALCRLLSNLRNGGVFDGECEQKKSMATMLVQVVETMWGFAESFVLAALGVAYLIDLLLRSDGELYKSYTESVPHNVHFGLPDGGYLELSLLTLLHALRRLDARYYSDWSVEMGRLIRWCDSLRRLWRHPPVGSQSPLLTQPVNAVTSQPYLVLIRMYAILGHLATTMPLQLGMTEATMVVGWITETPKGVAGELLGRPEFVSVAETILSSIQL
ncbi:hypothetical protein PSACC_00248 [Paramicrosporidium saccamoebae]|uniref:ARID domain-containing protein n=1 Tax=Paramicrosporidium saccamoebae TaxID=1246581 RepID=A0A2H9TQC3_9FUNG|nr:hypothetical protein PSACC_00248 [Paramicrosporidium saccamoebae]